MKDLFKTGDVRMDFILKYYDKVKDFEECLKFTQDNITLTILKKLKGLLSEWDYVGVKIDKLGNGANGIWWAMPGYYNEAEGIGMYYTIEIESGWDTLAGKAEYPAWLSLTYDMSEGRSRQSKNINMWIDKIGNTLSTSKRKSGLSKKGIKVVYDDTEWEDTLAAMYLDGELSLESLSTQPFKNIESRLHNKIELFVNNLTGRKDIMRPYFKAE
jgi:hypothetical protein